MGGFLTIVAPTLLYFYSKGALWAMIDDAYIFNIVYLGGGSANVDIQSNIVKMLPAFYVILLSLLYDRKFHVKYSFYLIPSSLLMIILHIGSRGYGHYFTSMLPLFLMAVILTYKICRDNTSRILLIFFLLFSTLNTGSLMRIISTTLDNVKVIYSSSYKAQREKEYKELEHFLDFIPQSERDQIYSYQLQLNMIPLIRQRINPVGKFFHFNEIYSFYPPYKEYLDDFHSTTNVKWVASGISREDSNLESFKQLLENYELVHSHENTPRANIYLYRRIN
ncbi:MAG: hypothetical protein SNH28_07130 [Rikenellaceae bacterium]